AMLTEEDVSFTYAILNKDLIDHSRAEVHDLLAYLIPVVNCTPYSYVLALASELLGRTIYLKDPESLEFLMTIAERGDHWSRHVAEMLLAKVHYRGALDALVKKLDSAMAAEKEEPEPKHFKMLHMLIKQLSSKEDDNQIWEAKRGEPNDLVDTIKTIELFGADAKDALPVLEAVLAKAPRQMKDYVNDLYGLAVGVNVVGNYMVTVLRDAIAAIKADIEKRKSLPMVKRGLDEQLVKIAKEEHKIPAESISDGRVRKFLDFLKEHKLENIVITGGVPRDIFYHQDVNDLDISVKIDLGNIGLSAKAKRELNDTLSQANEEIYKSAMEELGKLADAMKSKGMDVSLNDFLTASSEARHFPDFGNLRIQYNGPVKATTQGGAPVYLKRFFIDSRTGQAYYSTSGASLLKLAIGAIIENPGAPCDGRIYGRTEALDALSEGRAQIAGYRSVSDGTIRYENFGIGDILRLLRLKYQFGLKISDSDYNLIRNTVSKYKEGQLTLGDAATDEAYEYKNRILRTAVDRKSAEDELRSLGVTEFIDSEYAKIPQDVRFSPMKPLEDRYYSKDKIVIGDQEYDKSPKGIAKIKSDLAGKVDVIKMDRIKPGLTLLVSWRIMTALYAKCRIDKDTAYRLIPNVIEWALNVRGMDKVRQNLPPGPIMICMVDKSESVFEDNAQNGFIGVNKVFFERLTQSLYLDHMRKALFFTGIRHQLMYEAGEKDEKSLTEEDVKVFVQLLAKTLRDHDNASFESMMLENGGALYYEAEKVVDILPMLWQKRSMFIDMLGKELKSILAAGPEYFKVVVHRHNMTKEEREEEHRQVIQGKGSVPIRAIVLTAAISVGALLVPFMPRLLTGLGHALVSTANQLSLILALSALPAMLGMIREGSDSMSIVYLKGRRAPVPIDEYDRELFSQRWHLLRDGISRLVSIIGARGEWVLVDVVDHMPCEHIQKSAVERLVNELGFIHMLHVKYDADKDEKAVNAYVYNPPDVGHTELVVVAKYRSDVVDEMRAIIRSAAPGADIVSEWSAPSEGIGVFVFEVSVTKDRAAVALPKEELVNIRQELERAGYNNVDAAGLLAANKKLSGMLDKMSEKIKQSVPREISIPSVTGSDTLFLKVNRMTSILNHNTIISEEIIMDKDTDRQKEAKKARQADKLRLAVENALSGGAFSDSMQAKVRDIEKEVLENLRGNGANVLYAFRMIMNRYIRKLKKDGNNEDALTASRIREMVIREIESYASLATDEEIEEEIRRFKSIYDSVLTRLKMNRDAARDVKARDRWDTAIMILEEEIGKTKTTGGKIIMYSAEDFVRFEKKKAYVGILKIVKAFGEAAQKALSKYDLINADTSFSPDRKLREAKNLEAVVDTYYFMTELLRMAHNAGYLLPDNFAVINAEKLHAKEAIAEVRATLGADMRVRTQAFIDSTATQLDSLIVAGGKTATHIFNDLADEYIKAHPEMDAALIKHTSALFTYLMEGMSVPSYAAEEQENILYITDVMDQTHFDRLFRKNPRLASVGTFRVGNKASHWVITAKDMIMPERDTGIVLIPGITELGELNAGDMVIIDGRNKRLIINPAANQKIMELYFGRMQRESILRKIYRAFATGKAVTKDGYGVTIFADVPHARPDAALSYKFGSEGIGLIRLENRYMYRDEPVAGELAVEAREVADETIEPITYRLFDMAKDKLVDMIAIRAKVEAEIKAKGVMYEGVSFYFKENSDVGNRLAKSELKDLMIAYARSAKKNIRISVPNVQTEEDARDFKSLVEEVRHDVVADMGLGMTVKDLEGLKFFAMIESPEACISVEAILKTGIFSGISFGTNDLSVRSSPIAYERDDPRLARVFQELLPPFLRNIDLAMKQVDGLNRALPSDRQFVVMACGEWSNSSKFADYILGLMVKYPNLKGKVILVASSYSIGELKEHIRNVYASECADFINGEDVDAALEAFGKDVQDRIDQAHDVGNEMMRDMMRTQLMTGSMLAISPILFFLPNEIAAIVAICAMLGMVIEEGLFGIGAKKLSKRGSFVIGISSEGISPEELGSHVGMLKRVIRKDPVLANFATIEVFDNGITGFNEKINNNGKLGGIFMDRSMLVDETILLDAIAQVDVAAASILITNRRRDELERILKEIASTMKEIEKFDLDKEARAGTGKDRRGELEKHLARQVSDAKIAIAARKAAIERVYNMPVPSVKSIDGRARAIVTTEQMAVSDMFTDDEMLQAEKGSMVNCFVYGDELKSKDEAQKFLRDAGYKGNLENIKYIDKRDLSYAQLVDELARVTGVSNEYDINIRTVEGELGEITPKGARLLEVQKVTMNGVTVPAALGSYQSLIKIAMMTPEEFDGMMADIAAGKMPPGIVSYDNVRRVFRYLPKALPIDYGTELETYRRAMHLIRSAA
ncbi:MAG: hypothetical protein JXB40_04395, partial [Candidatus Omnitrophica bacterium]|nr:hypothetical protein [Candidatus Omnitrophota bacterium]